MQSDHPKDRLTTPFAGESVRIDEIGVEAANMLRVQTSKEVPDGIRKLAIYLAQSGSVLEHINAQIIRGILIAAYRSPLTSAAAKNAIRRHAGRVHCLCAWAVNKQVEYVETQVGKIQSNAIRLRGAFDVTEETEE